MEFISLHSADAPKMAENAHQTEKITRMKRKINRREKLITQKKKLYKNYVIVKRIEVNVSTIDGYMVTLYSIVHLLMLFFIAHDMIVII